ncbi:glycosyltransferase 87 family protein [Nocardioides sp. LHD-245]|uniref:glycosyltransferase family 87 protein n=1 Tax=Nocardioides sp. LHD-245 TaxID=3051387 RepID=UPI0027DFEBE6|nr:glycosyltransferase 87 family protein [Nocardioides sp. LHD-245]
MSDEAHVHPTRDDAVVAALSEVVGGPMGERARPHRWWTPTRVLLLLTAVVFAAGLVQKAPCSLAQGRDQNWVYSHMCYTDLRPLYVPRGLVEKAWPYSDDEQVRDRYDVMEYPVGIAYWAWGTAWVTQWLNGSPDLDQRQRTPVDLLYGDPEVEDEQTIFLLVNAVGFGALALLATWLLAGVHRTRPWDAAAFALSPALLLTGLINWDLLAVALVAGALWAWSRDRPVLTGVLIGLGTAAKLYPLFLLGGLLVICLRRRQLGRFAIAAVWAAAAWAAANAPAYLTGPEQWKVFWSFNSERTADLGSLWMLIDQAGDIGFSAHTINLWSWILFGAWCVVVFAIGMTAGRRLHESPVSRRFMHLVGVANPDKCMNPRSAGGSCSFVPRLAQLGYLIVVGFLLVNKVYSPQYVLWLLPLAVLARPRWRDQIVWQASEVFYFCTVWWYLGGYLAPAGGGDAGFYWVGIAVRVLGELYLAAVIVRDLYQPAHDPVAIERIEPGGPRGGAQPATTTRSNDVAV